MIHVQHLLGVGHLQRMLALTRALADLGFEVDLVSGGRPLPATSLDGISLHQLPPLYSADGNFDRLLDEHGQPIDDSWRATRCRQLLQHFERLAQRRQ